MNSVRSPCARLLAAQDVHEHHAILKLRPPGIAGQQGGRFRLDLGDDEGRRSAALIPQDPLCIVRDRQPSHLR